jgi:hypothetical protein
MMQDVEHSGTDKPDHIIVIDNEYPQGRTQPYKTDREDDSQFCVRWFQS